jgi:hypothetical protein
MFSAVCDIDGGDEDKEEVVVVVVDGIILLFRRDEGGSSFGFVCLRGEEGTFTSQFNKFDVVVRERGVFGVRVMF